MKTAMENLTPLDGGGKPVEHHEVTRRFQVLPGVVTRKTDEKRIRRQINGDGICVLTFDRPNSSANVFDRATLLELSENLDAITTMADLKGVVLISAKPGIFIAGADLHALSTMVGKPAELPSPDLISLMELGQSVFDRLANLPVPVVAAIHGACVGGGYELALAASYRLATPDRATKIGLPETQLGILPAWGGTTRLPRLIGLPKALELILSGKTLAAKAALKAGLVDELVPRERLLEFACQRILERGLTLRQPRTSWFKSAVNNRVTATLLRPYLRTQLMRKTRGHYPAVLAALSVATRGIWHSVAQSLALERAAVQELSSTEACHNLMRLFLLQERSKKMDASAGFSLSEVEHAQIVPATVSHHILDLIHPVERTAVIGAGVMGAGIAQWLSARGLPVVLRDINAEQIGRGLATIRDLYNKGVKRHTFTKVEAREGLDRVSPAPSEVPLQNMDLIIEAAVEKMDLKKQIFRRLAEVSGPDTILATNTSALSVAELAKFTKAPERVIGLHFFNPVHLMQLVEVVISSHTDPVVIERAVRFVQKIGKLPIVVSDHPGFLVNRILMPYLMEAVRLFEGGARVDDIDEVMLEFGMPMGPLRLLDEVGLDVAQHVSGTLSGAFGDHLPVTSAVEKMVAAGLLGRKSDHGFYVHSGKTPVVNAATEMFRTGEWASELSLDALRKRMVLLMVNEAARCLEEEVVSSPEDADFGMVMGTGFAPFLGGPLRYVDSVGAIPLVEKMETLAAHGETHFKPCALLKKKAETGETFYHAKGGLL